MRKLFLCSLALLLAVSSCDSPSRKFSSLAGFLHGSGASTAEFTVDNAHYSDSTAYSYFNVELDLPSGSNTISKTIRKSLLDVLKDQLEKAGFEEEYSIRVNIKDSKDATEALSVICPRAFTLFTDEAQKDIEELVGAMDQENFSSEQEYLEATTHFPPWEVEINLTLSEETDSYVVFESNNFVYYGGAHGGITGEGSLTFDKRTGNLFTNFIDKGKIADLQPLLIQGLNEYSMGDFSPSEDLFIEDEDDNTIPLPDWTPTPTKDGLCFTYQQYEIGPYAIGMPSFVIAYEKIAPMLTKEAKALLGL